MDPIEDLKPGSLISRYTKFLLWRSDLLWDLCELVKGLVTDMIYFGEFGQYTGR